MNLARIGPNAIIRAEEALTAFEGQSATAALFSAAGIARYLAVPPREMVEEPEVHALHLEMHRQLGDRRARSVAWIAGRRTADYLLANRIPLPVQRLLHRLPRPLASRILAKAIARNAWTFAGSGTLTVRGGNPTVFRIADCPLCRGLHSDQPYCDFYAATFERLFAVLIHPDAKVRETECAATGGKACSFAVAWPGW